MALRRDTHFFGEVPPPTLLRTSQNVSQRITGGLTDTALRLRACSRSFDRIGNV
jgi:hypothetical protein